jgi:tetratricopeptide (TPR) repeat protein
VYLESFGDSVRAADVNFRLAELLRDSGEYDQAVYEYEHTAYSRGNHPQAAEAGRSALLIYEQHNKDLAGEEKERWSRRSTASAIRFVESFPRDPDAAVVLARAGVDLLERGDSGEAIRVSEEILRTQAPLPVALRQTAWSILAQAQFERGDYEAAENAYRRALDLTEPDDPRRPALQEGMAATLYKHAAVRVAQGESAEAVTDFLRAANAAPESPIRPKAQYDAAASLLASEEWAHAARLLEQFRTEYPEHPLQREVTQKLAFAYQQSGRTAEAAAQYLRLGQSRGEDPLRREALLQAADLYAQAARQRDAVGALELYVTEFPSPADQMIEVLQRLADIEQTTGHTTRRQHWLREVVAADRVAGEARNARTRSLAAHASLELAEIPLSSFQRIELVEPLKDSLAGKLKEMKLALKALEEAAAYGVAPVTSAATYKIASMYDELSDALRTSRRPSNLSLEETAQYDLLMEEQAAPLEQSAIEFYQANVSRIPEGHYDAWVEKSLNRLAELWPARYARQERSEAHGADEQALAGSPTNPFAYNELGIRHRRAGRFQQARDAYERALELRPDYSTAHLNLGILCELYLQHRDCAMRQYELYQRLSTVTDSQVNLWIEDLRQRVEPQ